MAKTITLKDPVTREPQYPATLVSNVYDENGNPMVSIFPDKNLSTVTYPIPTAGSTTTGAGDRVIERYVSSDNFTWYEKYASGWKRCGFITTIASVNASSIVNVDATFPITFSNNKYHVQLTSQYGGAASGRCVWYAGGMDERTTNMIRLSCCNFYTQAITQPKCWVMIEGY